MANPMIHAKSSVKRWGGKVEEYLPIHKLLDSPKATMNNNTSRMLTHNTWFAYEVIPLIFGYNIINSDGRSVDVVDIAVIVAIYFNSCLNTDIMLSKLSNNCISFTAPSLFSHASKY